MKISNLIAIILLYTQSISAQSLNNFFYRKSPVEIVATFGGLHNPISGGNYYTLEATVKQTKKGLFFGGEGFISKSDFSALNPIVTNTSKTIIGGLGGVAGWLEPTETIITDLRMSIGINHISQHITTIGLGLFESFRYIQVQNDLLAYTEMSADINRDSKNFCRFVLGIRYEHPMQTSIGASLSGTEVKSRAVNRKNLQILGEVGVIRLVINDWAITTNLQVGYKQLYEPRISLYQGGILFTFHNKWAPVVWLGFNQDLKSAIQTKNYMISIDIINLSRGF